MGYTLFILTIKHILYRLNLIYTLLFITIHIIIHYILILKTNTLHYKLTLDKYTIHLTNTLFILTIKHTLSSLNIIYTLLFITIHIIIHYILILKQTLYTINLHINWKVYVLLLI